MNWATSVRTLNSWGLYKGVFLGQQTTYASNQPVTDEVIKLATQKKDTLAAQELPTCW